MVTLSIRGIILWCFLKAWKLLKTILVASAQQSLCYSFFCSRFLSKLAKQCIWYWLYSNFKPGVQGFLFLVKDFQKSQLLLLLTSLISRISGLLASERRWTFTAGTVIGILAMVLKLFKWSSSLGKWQVTRSDWAICRIYVISCLFPLLWQIKQAFMIRYCKLYTSIFS